LNKCIDNDTKKKRERKSSAKKEEEEEELTSLSLNYIFNKKKKRTSKLIHQ
jgi:hypothetical protein